MRKLYRKGAVHPSPSAPETISDNYLSFLPAAILTLTVGLSPEELEVVSYLITRSSSSSSSTKPRKKAAINHPKSFSCDCFSCYMSYWAKWDSSSNRDLIHKAIDAFEESLAQRNPPRRIRRRSKGSTPTAELETELGERGAGDSEVEAGGDDVAVVVEIKGPLTRFVSLIGERVLSVWGS